jgi:hypothetical protein
LAWRARRHSYRLRRRVLATPDRDEPHAIATSGQVTMVNQAAETIIIE